MREAVMHNAEPVSKREATRILVKILGNAYVKEHIKK